MKIFFFAFSLLTALMIVSCGGSDEVGTQGESIKGPQFQSNQVWVSSRTSCGDAEISDTHLYYRIDESHFIAVKEVKGERYCREARVYDRIISSLSKSSIYREQGTLSGSAGKRQCWMTAELSKTQPPSSEEVFPFDLEQVSYSLTGSPPGIVFFSAKNFGACPNGNLALTLNQK